MKHPFEAILSTNDNGTEDSNTETHTRRQMIGRAVSASVVVAGLGGIGGLGNLGGTAGAAESNDKPGSEGSSSASKPPATKPQDPTSTRKGEEGGIATTQAIGEEGGIYPEPTKAEGEEGGIYPEPTKAKGEEGGFNPGTSKAVGEEGGFNPGGTTKRVGEEGGIIGPPLKPTKFAVVKKHYDAAMKKDDIFAASSLLRQMKHHPEAEAHKTFLAKAEAAITKAGSAMLADAKAAAKKGDINAAFEKTRMLEWYFAQRDIALQANKLHQELRTKKGYKQASREFAAKQEFNRAEASKSIELKRRIYQAVAQIWPDTMGGKKAAEALKKLPARKVEPKPVPGRPTTLALGEEG